MLVGQMLFGAFRPRTTREIKKVTASERSAITDLSRDTALVARSRRTSRVLTLPMLLGAFDHQGQEQDRLRYALDCYGTSFDSPASSSFSRPARGP